MFVLSLLWFAATAGNHTKDVGFVEPRALVDYQPITEGGVFAHAASDECPVIQSANIVYGYMINNYIL